MNTTSRGPIWFGIGLVVVVLGIGGWIYFMQPSQSLNVGITLATNPSNVLVGDPFDLSVGLTNDAGSALQNASIALVLPSGIISVDSPSQRVITQPLGNVSAGGISHQDFHLLAAAGVNTVLHLTAKVSYFGAGSNAQFVNNSSLDIPIGGIAVNTTISTPSQVFSGENFPITVNYNNNANHTISGLSLAMQYPPAFSFVSASSSLVTNGNSSWSLGSIPANASGSIVVNGNIVGPTDASYPIGAVLSDLVGSQSYPIANPTASVSLTASPIIFTVTVNNLKSYVSKAGDSLNYVLTFTNNSSIAFQNSIITAKLAGTMFDFSSLQSAGSFNSVANTITWNAASVPQLLSLASGQSGSVNFDIRTKNVFPIRLLSDKNYSVSVSAKLFSPTVPPGTAASSTISISDLTTKLGGEILLGAKGYHHEPIANIANAGPYPPRVNQPTQYTVHWLITNFSTDANNVTISASLQSGTTCTGKSLVTPASSTFVCNPANGQISWQIPVVPATTGIADKPLEAMFQVSNTPAVNQIGQAVTLVNGATLIATDAFTSSTIQAVAPAITTALPDDTSFSTSNRGVMQ